MKQLKNIVIGFMDAANEAEIARAVADNASNRLQTFTKDQAEDEFMNPRGIFDGLKRYVQRNIGGGPAEFLQDVRKMTTDDRLVTVDTSGFNDVDSNELIHQLLESGVCRIKRFGKFSVEHVTHEESHSAEIPAFGWVESEALKQGWTRGAPNKVQHISESNQ